MATTALKDMRDIMRDDGGLGSEMQRIEQITWLFFLKMYDAKEQDKELMTDGYKSILLPKYQWRTWTDFSTGPNKDMTEDKFLSFVNNELFPYLKGIPIDNSNPFGSMIPKVFEDINQYMKKGIQLKKLIMYINNHWDFTEGEDTKIFGAFYEEILHGMSGQKKDGGEFYTPRPLTDFIIERLNPQLTEKFADFASGTGGFLNSCVHWLEQQLDNSIESIKLFDNAILGQEMANIPYILSLTNLMASSIETPNILHTDSLLFNTQEVPESQKVDVVAMNPPFGGNVTIDENSSFPKDFQCNESANLFLALIIYRLKANGRCGIILPDTFLNATDDVAKRLKETLIRDFNLHTIIRLPNDIFAPYTNIAVNILFFNKTEDKDDNGLATKEVWYYRLNKPEGYKHFSKTKPLLAEHLEPIKDWWDNREEIINSPTDIISQKYTGTQMLDPSWNFCPFPKDIEDTIPVDELINDYYKNRKELLTKIDNQIDVLVDKLNIKIDKDL